MTVTDLINKHKLGASDAAKLRKYASKGIWPGAPTKALSAALREFLTVRIPQQEERAKQAAAQVR